MVVGAGVTLIGPPLWWRCSVPPPAAAGADSSGPDVVLGWDELLVVVGWGELPPDPLAPEPVPVEGPEPVPVD